MSVAHDHSGIALYALDALPFTDREETKAHIETCPDCRHDLDAYHEVVASLVPDRPPPAGLWPRIEQQLDAPIATHPTPSRGARGFATRLAWAAAAALALVLAVFAGDALFDDSGEIETRITGEASVAAQEPGAIVSEFLVDGTSVAEVVLGPDGEGFVIPTSSLDPLEPSRTYQLWVITPDSRAISAGLLGSIPRASTFTWIGAVSGFALTREVAGGVPQSAGDVVSVIEGIT